MNKVDSLKGTSNYDYWDKILQTNIEYELVGAHKKEKILNTAQHSHGNMCEIILNCNGVGYTTNNGQRFPVNPNSLIIHNKNALHSEELIPISGNSIELYYCAYTSFKISKLEDLQLIGNDTNPVIPIDKELTKQLKILFKTSLNELENKGIGFTFIAYSYLAMVFLLTLRELIHHDLIPLSLDSDSPNYAAKAKQLIDESFMDMNFSIYKIAMSLNISQSYLTKLFREQFKTTPSKYMNEKRILKARKLLLTTRLSNEEISHQIGFSDPINFYRTFKKFLGTTPNQFRVNTEIYTLFPDK